MRNICVPINFSDTAKNALRMAIHFSIANKSKLNILHILRPMSIAHYKKNCDLRLAKLKEFTLNSIKSILNKEEDIQEVLSLSPNFDVQMSSFGKTIQQFQKSKEIDITVIRMRTIYRLKEMINGKTSNEYFKI